MNAYFAIETKEMYIYPKQSLPDGYDPTSRGWYKEALSNKGNVIITPPYENASTGANVITIAKAVVKDNKVVGVVAIDCSLKTLASKIANMSVEVNQSVGEVARAIEEVSKGAVTQAEDAQEGAIGMENLSK